MLNILSNELETKIAISRINHYFLSFDGIRQSYLSSSKGNYVVGLTNDELVLFGMNSERIQILLFSTLKTKKPCQNDKVS